MSDRNTSNRTVLVLGAGGRLGQAAVLAFHGAGWHVLAHARRPPAVLPPGAVHVSVALEDIEALVAAARGATTVVYGVNPLYTKWTEQMMPLARHGFEVARRLGALFMLPGNVYAYGENMPPVLEPGTPERPTNEKGRQRAELEAEMERYPELRSVVIRAGDFYGSGAGSWLDQAIVKSLGQGKLVYPGPLDVPHAWAYLPDLARAFVAVAEGDDRTTRTRRVAFAGHTLTGQELLDLVDGAAAELGVRPARGFRIGGIPWALLRAGGLFVPMWRELASMAYLWRVAHRLDGAELARLAPGLASTPPTVAMREALAGLGFGDRQGSASAAA